MDGHGVARPLSVPLTEKFHQQSVVPARVFSQPLLVLSRRESGGHRLIDEGKQPHQKLIVGAPDDGCVKGPVGLGSVLPRPDAPLHL